MMNNNLSMKLYCQLLLLLLMMMMMMEEYERELKDAAISTSRQTIAWSQSTLPDRYA